MSLKRRLGVAERRAGTIDLGDVLDPLVDLVGHVDGLFWPVRQASGAQRVATKNARAQYHTAGIDWSMDVGQGSSRAWKQAERLRRKLKAAGFVTLTDGKARLTDQAQSRLRPMIGLRTINSIETAIIATRLFQLTTEGYEDRHGGWISETTLFCTNYDDHPKTGSWYRFFDWIMPLLIAGRIESKLSTVGHVFYRQIKYIEVEPEDRAEPVAGLVDRYLDGWQQRLAILARAKPTNEIDIPLSATR